MIKRDQKTAEAKPEAPNTGRRVILFDLHQLPIMVPPSDARRSPPSPIKMSRILADCGKLNLKEILRKHKISLYKFEKYIRPLLDPKRYSIRSIDIDAEKRKLILADCGKLNLKDLLRKHKITITTFNKYIRPMLGLQGYRKSISAISANKQKRILADCGRITIKNIIRKHKITYYHFKRQIWPLLGLKQYRTILVDEKMRKRFMAECGRTTLKALLQKYEITYMRYLTYIKPFLGMKRYKVLVESKERAKRRNAMIKLYYEGMSLRKIGKIHGISGEMVRVHLRGKVDIKRHMKALLAARKIRKQLQSEKRT
jgi:DNA-binding CsgD family transcriptional regulator